MSDAFSLDELDEAVATLEEPEHRAEPDDPFRIALLGDWSGRGGTSAAPVNAADLKPLLIDRDNLDEMLSQLRVRLTLPVADQSAAHLNISFNELEDFHPDRIYERVELFDALRQLRERLEDESTFAEAAREMRAAEPLHAAAEDSRQQPEQTETLAETEDAESGGASLLDRLLEESSGEAAPAALTRRPEDAELQAMLREVVRPHLTAVDETEQESLLASVDEATSKLMRSILHHTDFQALEAAWRALSFLVSHLETDTDLRLYLLDITKEELAADLLAVDDVRQSALSKLLVDGSVNVFGGEPWALFAGNYTFEATADDARLLSRLGHIARGAGAPFIAASGTAVLGCDSLAETPDPDDWRGELAAEDKRAWEELRASAVAGSLGLVLPRFLLRLPYGAETEPTELFDFEELPEGEPAHANYLWANPAFACVYLLAEAFTRDGWDLQPGSTQDIEGLPLHVYEVDGETYIKPCAEVVLTTRAAVAIMEHGLMPLLSFSGRDTVRLARFQSLSRQASKLAGRWE